MLFKKVVVGISGGVDSAVSAYLLKSKGFQVCGAFMQNWDLTDETGYCSADKDYEDAQYVCNKLNIPLYKVNFVKQYWIDIFGSFLRDYENGVTPNPDILCNRFIKFNLFYKYATTRLKADSIATGHYARTSFGNYLDCYDDEQKVKLLKAEDTIKDQTFFLSQIEERALRKTMFPLGNITKHDVKEIAMKIGMEKLARKKESVGICFVGNRKNFKTFISEYIDTKPGNFIDYDSGKIISTHTGIHNWTVGQGIHLGGCLKPYYVYQKNISTNDILVVSGTHHPLLFTDIVYTDKPKWINDFLSHDSIFEAEFRFQHTKPLVKCKFFEIEKSTGKLCILLERPLRALTPGQYAVLYKDEECLGSARIIKPGPSILYSSLYYRSNNVIT